MKHVPHVARRAVVMLFTFGAIVSPPKASAQERWKAAYWQAGAAVGAGEFVGLGTTATAELGVVRHLRVFAEWNDWQALAGCYVTDAPSLCNGAPTSWQLGLRQGLGLSERVAPFVGGGLGAYRRNGLAPAERRQHLAASLSGGVDFRVVSSVAIRMSLVYHEVLSPELRQQFGGGVRLTGYFLGLGFAVW